MGKLRFRRQLVQGCSACKWQSLNSSPSLAASQATLYMRHFIAFEIRYLAAFVDEYSDRA